MPRLRTDDDSEGNQLLRGCGKHGVSFLREGNLEGAEG